MTKLRQTPSQTVGPYFAYGLSPEQYRERFDLWDDYPMDAAVYTKVRSDLAKARGLGKTILWADRPRADPDRRTRKRREG